MDDIKDIQKSNPVTVFLDVPTKTNPFGLNRAAERAYRRCERICAAAYLLTGHIPERENIRSEVRAEATGLLSDALSLRDGMRSAQSKKVSELQARIRHLISLFRVLGVAGFISEANTVTMAEALEELGHFASASQRSALSENVSISREDLMDIGVAAGELGQRKSIKDTRPSAVVKDTGDIKDRRSVSDKKTNTNGTAGARIQNIMQILRSGGSLGIKDIAANLPEYSEKMIQRELLGMVSRGEIRKIGLKRWSKYTIAA